MFAAAAAGMLAYYSCIHKEVHQLYRYSANEHNLVCRWR